MGCSGSINILEDKKQSSTSIKYPQNDKEYKEKHDLAKEKLSVCGFYQEVDKYYTDIRSYTYKKEFNKFISSYQKKVSSIDKNELAAVIHEHICERIIRSKLYIGDVDIFKTAEALFPKLLKVGEDVTPFKNAFKPLENEFRMDLSTLVYFLNKDLKTMSFEQLKHLNDAIKYNPDSRPNVISFKINQKFLEEAENADNLEDAIGNLSTLQIVCIVLCPDSENGEILDKFGFDCAYYKVLFQLFKGIVKNKNIKALIFHSIKDYEIMIAPEICNLIMQKIQSENLKALHLGGFDFSDSFYDKLIFQVASTRSINVLSFSGIKFWRHISEKGLSYLQKNKTVSLLAFSEIPYEGQENENIAKEIEDFKNTLTSKNDKLKVLITDKPIVVTDFSPVIKN